MLALISRVGKSYVTDQSDIWDIVALRCYGDEHAMSDIIMANYEHRYQDFFPANVSLNVPRRTKYVAIDLKVQTEVPDIRKLLPWR